MTTINKISSRCQLCSYVLEFDRTSQGHHKSLPQSCSSPAEVLPGWQWPSVSSSAAGQSCGRTGSLCLRSWASCCSGSTGFSSPPCSSRRHSKSNRAGGETLAVVCWHTGLFRLTAPLRPPVRYMSPLGDVLCCAEPCRAVPCSSGQGPDRTTHTQRLNTPSRPPRSYRTRLLP